MKRYSPFVLSILLVIAVALVGCSQPAAASTPPDEVVDTFYHWYLGYPGNVLSSRAYRDSEYLTDEFKAEVDEIIRSFVGGAYDPFLMAQDIPQEVTAGEVVIDGDHAIVTVRQDWSGGMVRELTVELQLVGNEWLIDNINPPETSAIDSAAPSRTGTSPDGVVRDFYGWYLDHIRGDDRQHNPLVDGAFRTTTFLSERLVAEVDDLLASFENGGYDPFLCAQDIPTSVAIVEMTGDDHLATIMVETDLRGHGFSVDVTRVDGAWQIDSVHCPSPRQGFVASPDPTEVVRSFYSQYQVSIGDRENPTNPLVAGAYRTSPYLAPELVAEIDELIASFTGGGYDPFFCAQDIPDSITVGESLVSGETATVPVATSFPGHSFELTLASVAGEWRITAVDCGGPVAEELPPTTLEPAPAAPVDEIPADWQVLRDEEYGFEIWYPADWAAVELPLRNPELDAPMVRLVQILPSDWAAKMNVGGPPDPNNEVYAPISLEVSVGSLGEYRRLYYEMPLIEEIEVNGAAAILEQDEPGDYQVRRYVFTHPTQDDLRVTLQDYIGGFPARVAGNQAVVDTMLRIVNTFSFSD